MTVGEYKVMNCYEFLFSKQVVEYNSTESLTFVCYDLSFSSNILLFEYSSECILEDIHVELE